MRYGILVSLILVGSLAAPTVMALPASEGTSSDGSIFSVCFNSIWGDSACCVVYEPTDPRVKTTPKECVNFVKVILSPSSGPPE